MIQYLKDLYTNFLKCSITKKVFFSILFVIYLLIILAATIKVDYVVTTPGVFNHTAITNLDDKSYGSVKIDTDNKSGNIYTIGVYSHIRVSYFQYLISTLSHQVGIDEHNPQTDLNQQESYRRGVILRRVSINNAIIVAYEAAKEIDSSIIIEKTLKGFVVTYVTKESQSNLIVGDIIKKINHVGVVSVGHCQEMISKAPNYDYFPIVILREGENEERTIYSRKMVRVDENGNRTYLLGVDIHIDYTIDQANPKYTINQSIKSIGSSGGAMLTLAIYNSLLSEDITNGKYIAGTGTISIEGQVGSIGGIGQKIVTAHLRGVDYFFIGSHDYEEALEMYQKINATFNLIKVDNFSDIINALEGDGS